MASFDGAGSNNFPSPTGLEVRIDLGGVEAFGVVEVGLAEEEDER